MVEKQKGTKIEVLGSVRGGEYISTNFDTDFCL